MIHEINSHDWPAFCKRITEQRVGATVKLEVTGSDGVNTEKVASAALQSMEFDATDKCSDMITFRLKSTREILHEIIEPIQIRLHSQGTSDDFNLISIEAESGTTLITLHPAIYAQMLDT